MANVNQKDNTETNLKDKLETISDYNADDLVQRGRLGADLSFDSSRSEFESLIQLSNNLLNLDLTRFSAKRLGRINSILQQIVQSLDEIESFNPSGSNPEKTRNQLLSNLDDRYHEFRELIHPILSDPNVRSDRVDELSHQLENQIDEVQNFLDESNEYRDELESHIEALDQRQEEIDDQMMELENYLDSIEKKAEDRLNQAVDEARGILENIRETSSYVGVQEHSNIFEDEANNHREKYNFWMKVTAGFAVLTIAVALSFATVFQIPSDPTTPEIIQFATGKLVVLSILYYGVIWSSRNYLANRHNHVVNKHRQNALSTFQTFTEAASDPETKDSVLIEATESIFSFRNSGFNKNEDSNQPGRITEVVRTLRGGSEL